jgi:hypothetical protein
METEPHRATGRRTGVKTESVIMSPLSRAVCCIWRLRSRAASLPHPPALPLLNPLSTTPPSTLSPGAGPQVAALRARRFTIIFFFSRWAGAGPQVAALRALLVRGPRGLVHRHPRRVRGARVCGGGVFCVARVCQGWGGLGGSNCSLCVRGSASQSTGVYAAVFATFKVRGRKNGM